MRHLTGSKKVLAVASAIFLVAAASGTALAMLDPGQVSLRSAAGSASDSAERVRPVAAVASAYTH